MVFADSTKAFDTVGRIGLQKQVKRCSGKFTSMIYMGIEVTEKPQKLPNLIMIARMRVGRNTLFHIYVINAERDFPRAVFS